MKKIMTIQKEKVKSYANGEFTNFLEDHINYFKSLVYKLEMMLTVYQEIKEDAKTDYGWVPTADFIKHLNHAKMELDMVFFEILQHQKDLLAGKQIWEEVQKKHKEIKLDLIDKKEEVVSPIYQ